MCSIDLLRKGTKMIKISDFGVERNSCELENGTEVVVFTKPNAPVSILVTFFSGKRFALEGKEGTGHLLEHMLLAGTEKFPTNDKLATYIERLGGIAGASIGPEMFNMKVAIGDPKDLEDAFIVLSEEINHPLFDDETLEKERKSIYNELASYEANPNRVAYKTHVGLVYQGLDVVRTVNQARETVAKITKKDLLDYKKKFICGNRMAVIVSGDVSLEKVKDLTQKYLLLSRGEKVSLNPTSVLRDKTVSIREFVSLKDQIKFDLSFRADISFLDKDSFALKILNTVLGSGGASILYKKLRYEKGLVYYTRSGSGGFLDVGDTSIDGETSKSDLDEVLEIIREILKELKKTGLSEKQIQFAKDKIIKSSKRRLQTSGSWVSSHSYSTLAQKFLTDKPKKYANKAYTIADLYNNIAKVTNDDVLRVLGKYVTSDNWFLSLVGSEIDENKYKASEFNF